VSYILRLQFPVLKSTHVYIKDEIALLKTINMIRQGGVNNLQVRILIYNHSLIHHSINLRLFVQIITDFDLTITKQHIDGRHVLSSFGKQMIIYCIKTTGGDLSWTVLTNSLIFFTSVVMLELRFIIKGVSTWPDILLMVDSLEFQDKNSNTKMSRLQ